MPRCRLLCIKPSATRKIRIGRGHYDVAKVQRDTRRQRWIVVDALSLDGLSEPGLGLVKVDDVPDGLEVVGLDVLVLEVEGVLPDLATEKPFIGRESVKGKRKEPLG
jgi:hypothetical protein